MPRHAPIVDEGFPPPHIDDPRGPLFGGLARLLGIYGCYRMPRNDVLKLVTGNGYFPRIAEEIRSREPKLPFLKQPHESREAHVPPHLFGDGGRRNHA